jgi:MFS family permease
MTEGSDLRRDLLWRIEARRAAVQAYLRSTRPKARRRASATIVLTSLAAAFTAGPAIGGETFAVSAQQAFGLVDDSAVWRLLCFLALAVSLAAAIMTQLGKSQEAGGQLAAAEAAAAELEGLATLVHYGRLPFEEAVKLYQQYTAKISFIEDMPVDFGPAQVHQQRPY